MNREWKNLIAFKIWTAVPRVEKYKIGPAVQILETVPFILFRNDSFTRGQSNVRRFINERSVTNIRDWSLAYSFIYIPELLRELRELLTEAMFKETVN